ncbi:hypothetical protein BDY21DRAFT_332860 [Lineolata rhizophorae]|uniref:Secreted protein n=1 Tax=Lineolata rhizophorae TaxID=578093 RepID=A0A6A6PCY5_9PEZI|nr:hypothetical protein BDY21DRAFT_332860 [Lineolata rhizophorae]
MATDPGIQFLIFFHLYSSVASQGTYLSPHRPRGPLPRLPSDPPTVPRCAPPASHIPKQSASHAHLDAPMGSRKLLSGSTWPAKRVGRE